MSASPAWISAPIESTSHVSARSCNRHAVQWQHGHRHDADHQPDLTPYDVAHSLDRISVSWPGMVTDLLCGAAPSEETHPPTSDPDQESRAAPGEGPNASPSVNPSSPQNFRRAWQRPCTAAQPRHCSSWPHPPRPCRLQRLPRALGPNGPALPPCMAFR